MILALCIHVCLLLKVATSLMTRYGHGPIAVLTANTDAAQLLHRLPVDIVCGGSVRGPMPFRSVVALFKVHAGTCHLPAGAARVFLTSPTQAGLLRKLTVVRESGQYRDLNPERCPNYFRSAPHFSVGRCSFYPRKTLLSNFGHKVFTPRYSKPQTDGWRSSEGGSRPLA